MFYPILKAVTNFVCGPNLTSADMIEGGMFFPTITEHIYMTVYSFGCLYSIEIYIDRIKTELLKVVEHNSYKSHLTSITSPEQLSVIYSLLKIFHPTLYEKLFRKHTNLYDINYLKNNLDKIIYKTDNGHIDVDIYLAIFALFDFPIEGGTLMIGGEEIKLVYDNRESDLELIPFGVDWAYMGRGLWLHMCGKIYELTK